MWPKVHITNVNICSMHVPQVKRFYMDSIRVGYTTKQIYDKHNKIWCAGANADEWMTWDDFLKLQDIAYLDQKHKMCTWCLHKKLKFLIQSWVCAHLDDAFYFQDPNEVNGIYVPFTIRMQTLNTTSCHVPIWSQQGYVYGCHVWRQWCEVPPIHINGVQFSSHKNVSCLDHSN